ncbi:helix-turn-helix transcriptional regulator [Streptomyces sp. SID8352]|uniref:helix-turn-helix domain-containing protein n=1 Tax=Streptomyces sp. SID8352 TaxID=2690338 RepID=UPI001371FBFF|nr:helix-turn-helix domain-containing protein [Streptomyces sp. SID8352]
MKARGQSIRRNREESGRGLTEFANRIGISPSYLSRIERDQANPSPGVMRRIAQELRKEQRAREAIAEITDTERQGDEQPSE